MPLTEDELAEIQERLYRYATERDRPDFDWELLGAKIALDAISVIAALRASQAEARRLREALAWYGEPRNYRVSSAASVNKIAWWPVVRDAGARARATLVSTVENELA